MSFDVFGDFEERGYLRNHAAEKDIEAVKRIEHAAFVQNVGPALDKLATVQPVTYQAVLDVHKQLFESVYPWAGKDRAEVAPHVNIAKGGYDRMFAFPQDVRRAAEYALKFGNDPAYMRQHPGAVMGELAHAHPFLDGNGRALMTVHTVLADRAGISIKWDEIDKASYLTALTKEIHLPGDGELDRLLAAHIGPPISRQSQVASLVGLKSLGPGSALADEPSDVARHSQRL